MTEQEVRNSEGCVGYRNHLLSSFYTEAGWGGLPSCFWQPDIFTEWI